VRSRNDDQRTVLVVDDHAGLRLSLQRLLEIAGYRVLAAANGAEAIVQLRGGRVHTVVLDIDMPVMNGRAFLAARSADAELARVPVVVYSADPRPAALPPGINAWIWKGTESAELLGVIAAQAR
jgi:two-component system, chemotaxis family, chemotaxis protein CheY